MKIDQLGEFGLIDRIRAALPQHGPRVLTGIGDDVAVLEVCGVHANAKGGPAAAPGKTAPAKGAPAANAPGAPPATGSLGDGDDTVWLATCDVLVEGSHFLREAIPPQKLGRKALAVNLSDIASAGGTPRFALVSLGLPGDLEVQFIDRLYEGLRDEAAAFGVDIVGGNISRSRQALFIDIFLLGEARRNEVVLRSGARPGDRVLVTGSLGDAAAGVALLLDPSVQRAEPYASRAVERQLVPTPRVREGALIGSLREATSMIDVSDGMAGDVGHICERSRVSVRLVAERLPVAGENRQLSRALKGNEWHFALRGGEDYELLLTAPAERAESLARRITRETGIPVSLIGEVLPPDRPSELVLPDGAVVPLGGAGWDHFK